jgi:lysyl-tRNA synthetase class 2
MREAIVKYWPESAAAPPTPAELAAPGGPVAVLARYNARAAKAEDVARIPLIFTDGATTALLFELVAEDKLIQPTLIYDFPTDISPLSKQRDDDPSLVERFEFFAGGLELGNAFSELNDPDEQERRFREQIARGGEEVPKELDLDYIRALCHGLPPTAGEGIGIDRLTMLLTDSNSIRDVILFPLMRPEASSAPAEPPPTEKK